MQVTIWLDRVNAILWHDAVLYALLGVGVLFTVWTRFGQRRALTHGVAVIAGRYDRPDDPGAINHFQALSAALSATVGLGNIAGVAIAVSMGGPGAVFWMWVTGFLGMVLKMSEVSLAMLYRDLRRPDEPHGGAMWVVRNGLAAEHPSLRPVGSLVGGLFCVTLLVSTFTGGNMFQAWNVADITHEYFAVPPLATGVALTLLTGLVIVGGIKRIGTVAGRLVPAMCLAYLVGGAWVLIVHADRIPDVLRMIVTHAFAPQEAKGAFLGGTFGWVFLLGMRRALFSNEAGQGSAPIAHCAARTDEPIREGVVAGLEPFIDTLVVCTVTAVVILSSGVWSRSPDLPVPFESMPEVVRVAADEWTLAPLVVSRSGVEGWREGLTVFAVLRGDAVESRNSDRHRLNGTLERSPSGDLVVRWQTLASGTRPVVAEPGVYREYKGATLTAKAFDSAPGRLGVVIVPLVAWLFAFSTMISWSYYGEQGVVFLFGARAVLPYRVVYCLSILVAASPLIGTEAELDGLSSLGTGVMLFANIPILLLFGRRTMRAYHAYMKRLDAGEFEGRGR